MHGAVIHFNFWKAAKLKIIQMNGDISKADIMKFAENIT